MTEDKKIELQSAAFERLLQHLDQRKDVQNIDLMNLAGFCRNCLSKWYREESEKKASLTTRWHDKGADWRGLVAHTPAREEIAEPSSSWLETLLLPSWES